MAIKIVVFDLDGTLAPSKGPISEDMAYALKDLLNVVQVCVISGGTQEQIFSQVVDRLPSGTRLRNLHIMPTSGAKYLKKHFGSWKTIYEETLTDDEVFKIVQVMHVSAALHGYWPEKPYGDVIENRGSQVTFSALGQEAPLEDKASWDPDGDKREALRRTIESFLPQFDVRAGGSTSIDVTKAGIDKGFGVYELMRRTGLGIRDVLFIGDRLDPSGNDYPVIRTGVMVQPVSNVNETIKHIKSLIKFTR